MPYKLSATLASHSADVRAVASPTDNLILSASRDTTAIAWARSSPTSPFSQSSAFRAGSRYVNAVTYLPATPEAPNGYLVAGGQDTVINIFPIDGSTDEPKYTLLGHSENVCTLDATSSGTIVSGSWDKTARVWKEFQEAYQLRGHSQAVWAVLAVDDLQVLTGSADKTIKLWHTSKEVRTFTGHNDAVRGLALVPDIGFASCSNDSEIRVWTLEGDPVYALSGHTSFVYSLSVLPTGEIVSSGEDRTVRVWRDGECAQTIVHPAISVWAVSTMPNGDIVSGTSDGVVRIFSASEERWASQEELTTYENAVAGQALPSQQIGDIKKSDLPGSEALSRPGTKDGQVLMIKNGSLVEAHQWDSSSGSWQKVGEVVDAVGSNRKQLYNGKEYDYVFDVDIQEGAPPLKLPYNVSENPYAAAQRFLAQNDLPMTYIDEVVRFIEKNTSGVNLGSNEFVDPYTGASRYQAPANTAPRGGSGQYVDPYTGASRYQSTAASTPPATSSNTFLDPFTGASGYSTTPISTPTKAKVLPVNTPLPFKVANVQAMRTKFFQLNQVLELEISTSSLSLSGKEVKSLESVFNALTKAVAASAPPTLVTTDVDSSHLDTVLQVLSRWPEAQRFPVTDLTRLIVAFYPGAFESSDAAMTLLQTLLQACDWQQPWSAPLPKSRETNLLLALRAFANALQTSSSGLPVGGVEWVTQLFRELGQLPYNVLVKTQRVALATIAFNFSCIALQGKIDNELRTLSLDTILQILKAEDSEPEAAYRALVALGNSLVPASGSPHRARYEEVKTAVAGTVSKFNEPRIRDIAAEISSLT